MKFILNDPEFNCDVYITRIPPSQRPRRTEPEKNSFWRCHSFKKYENLAKNKKTTPTHSKFIREILKAIQIEVDTYDYEVDATPVFLTNIEEIPSVEEKVKEKFPVTIGNLNRQQRLQADKLLRKYEGILASDSSELTCAEVPEHEIETGEAVPSKGTLYRSPPVFDDFVKKEVETLLKHGLIQETKSEWRSPIWIVKRKEKLRLVVDYRKLNKVTKKDTLPLPRIDETLDKLKDAKVFSTIDLRKGFWQVPMSLKDKHKTAFSTKFGTYEFNVMPFGLVNAPATFQRMMNKILSEFIGKFVEVYVDDIIIYSPSFKDHLNHLEKIFKALGEVKLKLSLEKSKFFQHEVKFLGHLITAQGILPDEKKVLAVRDYPIPKNLRELRGFLGLASYYRKFIEKFSNIAKPMNQLLKKNEDYYWNEACEESF